MQIGLKGKKTHLLAMLSILTAGVGSSAIAGTVATDDATQPVYSPSWDSGDNGGTGWGGGWDKWADTSGGGFAGQFIGSSTGNNGGDGDTNSDSDIGTTAWGLYAGDGGTSNAVRFFPENLKPGDTFTVQFDNGDVPGAVGIGLQNSSYQNLAEFYFGSGNAFYKVSHAGGQADTALGWTDEGVEVTFNMLSGNQFSFTTTALVDGSTTTTAVYSLQSPGGGQGVSQVRFFYWNPTSSNGDRDLFVNNMEIVDPVAPTVSTIAREDASPTAATAVDFLVTFSESVTGVAASNFTPIVTGSFSDVTIGTPVDQGSNVWKVPVTFTSGDGTLAIDLDQNLGSVVDIGSNALASSFTSGEAYTVASSGPEVISITRDTTTPTNGDSLDFTVTFNEPVSGVSTSNFSTATTGTVTGTVSNATATPPSATWTVTVGSVTGDGDLALVLSNGAGIQNGFSLPLATSLPFQDQAYAVDNSGPTPLITYSAGVTSVSPFTVDIVFDDATTGFSDTSDISVVGGSASNLQSTDSQDYSVDVTSSARRTEIQINPGAGADALGNPSAASNLLIVDSCGDDIITVDGANGTTDTLYHTASNSAPGIDSNTNNSFGSNGYLAEMRTADDEEYVYVFIEGTIDDYNKLFVMVDSDASAATGFAGAHPDGSTGESNALEFFTGGFGDGGYDLTVAVNRSSNDGVSYTNVIAYDAAGAVLSETFAGPATAAGGNVQHTVRGVEETLSFAFNNDGAADHGIEIAIPRNWLLNAAGECGDEYRVFAIVGGGGNNFWSNVSIPQNGVSGHIGFTGSGNENALAALTAPVFNYSRVDDLAPTVEGIAADVTGPTDADVINFTVRFSEPVSGFDAPADVTVDTTGGVTSSGVAITGGPIVYNVQVSGIDGNGSIGITVVNTGVQDAATNAMAAPASSSTIDIDNSTSVSEWLLLND